jgi:DNA-binding NarL/FixJ family response regulator
MIEGSPIYGDRMFSATPRQLEVMQYAVNGYNNDVIAHEMRVSVKTVEAHKTNFATRRSFAYDPVFPTDKGLRVNKVINGILDGELVVENTGKAYPFSRRENEVAAFVLNGMTTVEIADELCIAVKTVEAHMRNINRKLGSHTRLHTVGLITSNHLKNYRDYSEELPILKAPIEEPIPINITSEDLSIMENIANGRNQLQITRALKLTNAQLSKKVATILEDRRPDYNRTTALVSLVTELAMSGEIQIYNVPEKITLSQREMDIVTPLMDGLDIYEVAEIEGVYYKTIESYLRGIYPRIGARNRAHAFGILASYSKDNKIEVLD